MQLHNLACLIAHLLPMCSEIKRSELRVIRSTGVSLHLRAIPSLEDQVRQVLIQYSVAIRHLGTAWDKTHRTLAQSLLRAIQCSAVEQHNLSSVRLMFSADPIKRTTCSLALKPLRRQHRCSTAMQLPRIQYLAVR